MDVRKKDISTFLFGPIRGIVNINCVLFQKYAHQKAGKSQGIILDVRKKDYFKFHRDIFAGSDQTYHKLVACLSNGDNY